MNSAMEQPFHQPIPAGGMNLPDEIITGDDQRPVLSVHVSIFPDVQARKVTRLRVPWPELVERVKQPRLHPTKAAMPLIMLAQLGEVRTDAGSLRHEANVQAISGVALDYDGGELTLADAATLLAAAGITAVLYSTPSSTPEHPRWRALSPTSRAMEPQWHRELVGRANAIVRGVVAPESFRLGQSYYIGRAQDAAHYETQEVRGHRCIDEADDLTAVYPTRTNGGAAATAAAQALDDPILAALRERGLYVGVVRPGTYSIRCPWADEHTTETTGSATVYLQANFEGRKVAGFDCRHAHCADRTLGDLLDHLWLENSPAANADGQQITEDQPPTANATAASPWPTLGELELDDAPRDYPLDALPQEIRGAVKEVVAFVQCPVALAACSALSAISAATQALVDVERDTHLSGPSSLYFLAIAESGERKTKCDEYFFSGIREWQAEQPELFRLELARYAADLGAWEARCAGIKERIKLMAKKKQPTDEDNEELARIMQAKPTPVHVPRLLHTDTTPEALGANLANGWPSGAVVSSEAGIVFGGHGMKPDSIMRNLALLNALWDGVSMDVDRIGAGHYLLSGARLSIGLAAQPDTVRAFIDASKGLARGTGFAARFLIAWPESTQGQRFYRPAGSWVNVEQFNKRLRELLQTGQTRTPLGTLAPEALRFTPAAMEAWVAFHDDVERELRPSGDMTEVRDVASKAADNAARLACLCHAFQHVPSGTIDEDSVRSAARIVGWHLYEARRFLGDVSTRRELVDARKLDRWLIDRCRRDGVSDFSLRELQQIGPNATRKKPALMTAMAELVEAGRVRLTGKRKRLEVRPELIGGVNGAA